jgi:hypothetical protein
MSSNSRQYVWAGAALAVLITVWPLAADSALSQTGTVSSGPALSAVVPPEWQWTPLNPVGRSGKKR